MTDAERDAVLGQLVTRSEIAARRGTTVQTVVTWIARYPDFPAAVLGAGSRVPYFWWPDVALYCEANNLPRFNQQDKLLEEYFGE